MKNGTTTLRPASDRSRPTSSATRHVNIPVDESVAGERRGLLIVLLGDAIEGGPVDLQGILCALIGTSLAALPDRDLDGLITAFDTDLLEELSAIAGIIDKQCACPSLQNLLRQSKSFAEYVATVRASGAGSFDARIWDELEDYLCDMLDVYLRLWELRVELVGADRDKWREVKAPQLETDPRSATADKTSTSSRVPQPGVVPPSLAENRSFAALPFALIEAACDSSPLNLMTALRYLEEAQMLIYPGHGERALRIANKIEIATENMYSIVDYDHQDSPREAFFASAHRGIAEAKAEKVGDGYGEIALELLDEAYRQATELYHELHEQACRKFGEKSCIRERKAKPAA